MTLSFADTSLRLVLAALLGALVGLERDIAVARGAGARTHALVALGSAVFTLAGAYGFADLRGSGASASSFDPARVAAQVATGVGFIDAGAILRHGTTVLGITTAATVWLAAATGVLVAAGATAAAVATIGAAIIILVALRAAKPLIRRLGRGRAVIEVVYERGHGTLGPCLKMVQDQNGQLEDLWVEDDRVDVENNGIRSVTLFVVIPRKESMDRLLVDIGSLPEVRSVRLTNASEW